MDAATYISKMDQVYKLIKNNPVKKIEKEVAAAIKSSNILEEPHPNFRQTDTGNP